MLLRSTTDGPLNRSRNLNLEKDETAGSVTFVTNLPWVCTGPEQLNPFKLSV